MPEQRLQLCDKCCAVRDWDPGVVKYKSRCGECHRVKLVSTVVQSLDERFTAYPRPTRSDNNSEGVCVCPLCEERIESLEYYATVDENGTCGCNGEELESSDSDTRDFEYHCPMCSAPVENSNSNRDNGRRVIPLSEWLANHPEDAIEGDEVKSPKA